MAHKKSQNADVLCVRHILHTVGPTSFGLGSVALNLVREQRALGIDAKIWCLDSLYDVDWALRVAGLPADSIESFKLTGPLRYGFSVALERAATGEQGSRVHILHQHGIWSGISRVSNLWRQAFRRPTVTAPHGSLEPWALGRAVWKKRLASIAYESKNFRDTTCFHATALPEADGIIRYGIHRPIALVPNGISNAWIESDGDGSRFRLHYGLPADVRILLYVGRITPVKNLEMLLAAMGRSPHMLKDWILVIAGTDEFGYKRKLENLIEELALERFVRFVAFVPQELKRDAYAAASALVLPSIREASPISVLEALGAGVPVLTTHGTPWQELEQNRCGWWCEVELGPMVRSLHTVLSSPPSLLAEYGARGRELVRTKYTWRIAAQNCLRLYGWIRGDTERPEFVCR